MDELSSYMCLAIDEARMSLREGNCGFGAVIVKDGRLVAKARDAEKTTADPTAHAEISAVRVAAAKLGRDLSGSILVSTHEPCPMCSTAALWSGISEIAYGFSIKEAIRQKRKRINITCREIYTRAGQEIIIHGGLLNEQCAVLYDSAVRDSIERLRNSDQSKLEHMARELSARRLKWFGENRSLSANTGKDIIDSAYKLFLRKLEISPEDAPVVSRDDKRLVLQSRNFCPTLEACKILDLDTRFVCRHLTENPTTDLLRQIHPKLRFTRNYDRLRPHSDYCEEMIILEE